MSVYFTYHHSLFMLSYNPVHNCILIHYMQIKIFSSFYTYNLIWNYNLDLIYSDNRVPKDGGYVDETIFD